MTDTEDRPLTADERFVIAAVFMAALRQANPTRGEGTPNTDSMSIAHH